MYCTWPALSLSDYKLHVCRQQQDVPDVDPPPYDSLEPPPPPPYPTDLQFDKSWQNPSTVLPRDCSQQASCSTTQVSHQIHHPYSQQQSPPPVPVIVINPTPLSPGTVPTYKKFTTHKFWACCVTCCFCNCIFGLIAYILASECLHNTTVVLPEWNRSILLPYVNYRPRHTLWQNSKQTGLRFSTNGE